MIKVKIISLFSNLFRNAIHAIESTGKIDVRINDSENWIRISVIDSGPGIPDEHISKIFEPMYTTKQQGTGLGLSICKKIIEQHGGTIEVANTPTTFTILFPKSTN